MDVEISTPKALIARIDQEVAAIKKDLNQDYGGPCPAQAATAAKRERLSTLLEVLDWIKTVEVERAREAVHRALGLKT